MALGLIVPWLLQQAIDVGGPADTPDFMVTAGLTVLGIRLRKALLSFGQRYHSQWLAFRVASDLKNRLYQHIQSLSFSLIRPRKPGS